MIQARKIASRNNGQPAPPVATRIARARRRFFRRFPSTVIAIRPTRSIVKKGEVICELDSAALRDQLTNQRITVESAKAIYEDARLITRERRNCCR